MEAENIYSLEWTNNVRTIGRVFVYNGILWLSYSGCGIEFVCNGGFKVKLVADNMAKASDAEIHYARYAVYMDGALIADNRLKEADGQVLSIGAEGEHTFRLIKLSESADSSLGLSALEAHESTDGETSIRISEAAYAKIEFVGDSITCGYGVEGDLSQTYTTATENVTKAWAYLTAENLGTEYSIISKSGAGIISGYTGDGVKNTDNVFPEYYERMGCTMGGIAEGVYPQDFEYDFSYEPDVIVVNLGTNDISYCKPLDENGNKRISDDEESARRREFYSEYKKFISRVRELNPFARILCILGVMGTALNGEVETAVRELQAEGDVRMHMLLLDEQDQADGLGTDYHPSAITQKKLAEKVTAFIRAEHLV